MISRISFLSVLSVLALSESCYGEPISKPVIGQKEMVTLNLNTDAKGTEGQSLSYVARVDTGATTSSIHATNIERSGERVHFTIYSDDRKTPYRHTAKFIDQVRVVTGEGAENRIKVLLHFRIGDNQTVAAHVTLNDRSTLTHGFLIGRNVLDSYLVDVSRGKNLKPPTREKPTRVRLGS